MLCQGLYLVSMLAMSGGWITGELLDGPQINVRTSTVVYLHDATPVGPRAVAARRVAVHTLSTHH